MRSRRARWVPLAGVVTLGLMETLCPSVGQTSDTTQITMKDFTFMPTPLTVKAGATVTWTNQDDEPHNVVSDTADFKSGGLDTNERFSHRFDKPGAYHFTCSIHPRMVGTIVVQ